MAVDIAKPTVEIRDWPGLMPGVDARDIPDGASVEQINCLCIVPGELMPRRGLRPVVFDSDPAVVVATVDYFALLDSGDYFLLENGDNLILG